MLNVCKYISGGDNMENVLNWINANTDYEAILLDQSIDHDKVRELQSKKGYVPKHKKYTVQLLQDVPTRSGVYLFFDKHSNIIYVGKTAGLRERIRQHIQGNGNTKDIKEQFIKVAYVRCVEYDAKQLERELIEVFKPYGNILGVSI
jgi:predicted GIY-YIG superfamily endonuclease